MEYLQYDVEKMALNIDKLEKENRRLNNDVRRLQEYCLKQGHFNDAQTDWLKQLRENNDELWAHIKKEKH
tara:strand:+ start:1428 stop:1637 length:210 start_codon:yes stop_codon:yes gene_type:complete